MAWARLPFLLTLTKSAPRRIGPSPNRTLTKSVPHQLPTFHFERHSKQSKWLIYFCGLNRLEWDIGRDAVTPVRRLTFQHHPAQSNRYCWPVWEQSILIWVSSRVFPTEIPLSKKWPILDHACTTNQQFSGLACLEEGWASSVASFQLFLGGPNFF